MSRGRVETLNQIHEGRMISLVDEEADFGKESRFPPHAVRLQLARVVIEEVTGEVVSIQSSVEHSERVTGRFPSEHRVKTVDHTVRASKDEPALGVILQSLCRLRSPLRVKPAHREPAPTSVLFAALNGPA
jgi:hypothetical protein